MTDINWVQVSIALFGGGSAGAVINTVVSAYRAQRQPVGRRIEVVPVFRPSGSASQLRAEIATTHQESTATFENLFLAEIQVANRGNKDLEDFGFGATLGEGDKCIFVEAEAPDRHHHAVQQTAVTPQAPKREIDFTLKPFNRSDSYSFKMYVVIPAGRQEPQKIGLGSSAPVRFVDMPTVGEIMASAASEFALNLGPFRIGLRR